MNANPAPPASDEHIIPVEGAEPAGPSHGRRYVAAGCALALVLGIGAAGYFVFAKSRGPGSSAPHALKNGQPATASPVVSPVAVMSPVPAPSVSSSPAGTATPVGHTGALVQPGGLDPQYASLPLLSSFQAHPTDQFLVDMDVVYGGFPYKGKRANTPHSGAHIEFDNRANQWPKGGSAPKNYPAIYAVADGIVSRITKSFAVTNDQGTHDRYGINIAIAQDGTAAWSLEYSIEPLVPEPSPGFYLPFMLVGEGDHVKKGQIIGYMYLPPGEGGGSHIHFELITTTGATMKAPAIFTPAVVSSFHDHWGAWGNDGSVPMPACMGWKLDAGENPFDAGVADVLE